MSNHNSSFGLSLAPATGTAGNWQRRLVAAGTSRQTCGTKYSQAATNSNTSLAKCCVDYLPCLQEHNSDHQTVNDKDF